MAKSNIPELVPFGNFLLKKYGVDAVVTAEDLAAFDALGEQPLKEVGINDTLPDVDNGVAEETSNVPGSVQSESLG